MYSFDPAINYGPNDVGASAISIILVLISIVAGVLLLAAGYNFLANLIKGGNNRDD